MIWILLCKYGITSRLPQPLRRWVAIRADDAEWNRTLASPEGQQLLNDLAVKAMQDYHEGKTTSIEEFLEQCREDGGEE